MEFNPDDNDSGVLQLYSANGTLPGDRFLVANHPFTLEIISAGAPIAYLLASYGDTGLIGALTFETLPVPLPSGIGVNSVRSLDHCEFSTQTEAVARFE